MVRYMFFKCKQDNSEIYKALWFKGGIMKKISKKAFDPIDKEERDLMEAHGRKRPWRRN